MFVTACMAKSAGEGNQGAQMNPPFFPDCDHDYVQGLASSAS